MAYAVSTLGTASLGISSENVSLGRDGSSQLLVVCHVVCFGYLQIFPSPFCRARALGVVGLVGLVAVS